MPWRWAWAGMKPSLGAAQRLIAEHIEAMGSNVAMGLGKYCTFASVKVGRGRLIRRPGPGLAGPGWVVGVCVGVVLCRTSYALSPTSYV